MRNLPFFSSASSISLACAALAMACGASDLPANSNLTNPDATDGGTTADVPGSEDGGASDGSKDPATKTDAGTNGWTTLLPSAWALTKAKGCDPNVNLLGLAIDPGNPNHIVTTQECVKGMPGGQTKSLIILDLETSGVTMTEIPGLPGSFRSLGVAMTPVGRALFVAGAPVITLYYHDPGAPKWLSVSQGYSPFNGTATLMATSGPTISLIGEKIYDVSSTSNTAQWLSHGYGSAGGGPIEWMAIDPTDSSKVVVATSFPLAVKSCSLPAGAGDATCTPKPADQGLSGIAYPAWDRYFVHRGSLDTIWAEAGSPPKMYASTDRGLSFAPLALPAPCLDPSMVRAFAGDPKDPKTFVIAQSGKIGARFFATRNGGVTFHELPAFDESSADLDIAIDGNGALVATSYGTVRRRAF